MHLYVWQVCHEKEEWSVEYFTEKPDVHFYFFRKIEIEPAVYDMLLRKWGYDRQVFLRELWLYGGSDHER